MSELPKVNDVMLVTFGFRRSLWSVHKAFYDAVLVGPKAWLVSGYQWWDLDDLTRHNAKVVGRCIRIGPFKVFRLNKNVGDKAAQPQGVGRRKGEQKR